MNTYNPGQGITLSTTFVNDAGAPTDPTAVFLDLRRHGEPEPTVYTYGVDAEIVRAVPGSFSALIEGPHEPGTWYYGWRGEGAIEGAEQGAFLVRRWLPGELEAS